MSEPTAMTLAQVISAIGDFVTGMITWMSAVVTAVTSNPLLLAFVLVSFIGIGISVFKRLTR